MGISKIHIYFNLTTIFMEIFEYFSKESSKLSLNSKIETISTHFSPNNFPNLQKIRDNSNKTIINVNPIIKMDNPKISIPNWKDRVKSLIILFKNRVWKKPLDESMISFNNESTEIKISKSIYKKMNVKIK